MAFQLLIVVFIFDRNDIIIIIVHVFVCFSQCFVLLPFSYKQCFVNSEAIDWLMTNYDLLRPMALSIAQTLLDLVIYKRLFFFFQLIFILFYLEKRECWSFDLVLNITVYLLIHQQHYQGFF